MGSGVLGHGVVQADGGTEGRRGTGNYKGRLISEPENSSRPCFLVGSSQRGVGRFILSLGRSLVPSAADWRGITKDEGTGKRKSSLSGQTHDTVYMRVSWRMGSPGEGL